jgi:hypothetical protein
MSFIFGNKIQWIVADNSLDRKRGQINFPRSRARKARPAPDHSARFD